MAGAKFLRNVAGTPTEVRGVQTSTADEIVALDTNGLLDPTMFPAGIGGSVVNMEVGIGVTAGDFVNIYNNTTIMCRPANATDATKPCHGFVLTTEIATAFVDVYFEGINTAATASTLGAIQFLAVTDGDSVGTAPSAAGNIVQRVGVAHSLTAISFEANLDWIAIIA